MPALGQTNLNSVFQSLFGDGEMLFQENGKWTFHEVPGYPKLPNEGILDYVFRLLNSGQILFNKGAWNSSVTYPKNSLVSYDFKYWVATLENTNSIPSMENPEWDSLLYTLEGLKGDKGDAGDQSFAVAS